MSTESERTHAPGAVDGTPASVYDRRSSTPTAPPAPKHARPTEFDPITVPLEPGISLVEASAGTGKTFCITLTVLRLLLEPDAAGAHRSIGRILVVTFTNAATDELITRLRRTLRDAVDVFAGLVDENDDNRQLFALRGRYGPESLPKLRVALRSLDQLAVFTIHGFCKRVLEVSALESGTPFDTTFLEDDAQLVERAAQDWWRRTMYGDARLAAMAVGKGWAWDSWLDDLKSVRRSPDTVIEPDTPFAEANRSLDAAVAAFAKVWDRDAFVSHFGGIAWLKDKGLFGPGAVGAAADLGDRLAAGDLAGGIEFVNRCTNAALMPGMPKKSKADKAAAEALPNVPVVAAADRVAAGVDGVAAALRVSFLREVEHDFQLEKARRHAMGFDDLLRRLHDAITREGSQGQLARAIRQRYDAALIDEFQDTDPYQFPIFRNAFDGLPLFLIGDPKQAIYGFRGADIFAYMAAAEEAAHCYTLPNNWRSTPAVVEAVNTLFTRRKNGFLYGQIAYQPVKAARERSDPLAGTDDRGAMHWMFVPPSMGKATHKGGAEGMIRDACCREIVGLLSPHAGGPARLSPGQIAILVRSGWEGQAFQTALAKLNVPSIISGMGSIVESREMRELERVLRAVLRPQHAAAVRAALATELWGLNASAIHRLSLAEHEAEWQEVVEWLLAAREAWARHGFMRAVQELMGHLRVTERLLACSDGERRVTNLRHAVEVMHGVAAAERLSPEALLAWVARARARANQDRELTELRLESDADAVQIVTIHKSKGLEYDVVFCPSLYLPRKARDGEPVTVHEESGVVFDHGSPARAARGAIANAERLADDLRLAYVALTRARFRTYVAWGAVRNSASGDAAWESSLGYLLRASGEAGGTPGTIAARTAAEEARAIDDWEPRLDRMVHEAGGRVMSKQTLESPGTAVAPWAPTAGSRVDPVVRTGLPSPGQLDTWRIASFTSLTASSHLEEERDVGDGAGAALVQERPALDRGDFMAFPSGREAGVALHEVFERLDFQSLDAVEPVTTDVLRKWRFVSHDSDARVRATTGMVNRVLADTLPGAGFALRDVPMDRTLREWKFHLPLGETDRRTLARLFATHGDALAQRYAPSLQRIGPARTHGFLSGVVDLAFEHHGRWHVVDWKSNHLGTDASAYEAAALEGEMFDSHYVLQYHLYVAALHRFLRSRIADYDYDTHLGGVWYAFLRGVDGTGRGWHAHRPARALVEALDELMIPVRAAREASA